ncbi:hypothetical protein EXIGLDRAFT_841161 [Exidia glandulosa HHB12029]|uniref:Uncharacterized protein n=1 Tax=Exidia glandulosa HHB12029 TaxID=1314781 RepID=A0A165E1L6_EXIGL|nr:hypothetical protein EXIGLDRAFT_841161 [Exidia glandulosa HHB12029]
MEPYQNTVVSIALEGLVQRSDGSPVTACLQRCDFVPNIVELSPVRALLRPSRHWMVRPDNGTPRHPSTLPPPGDVQLTLKLGSFLGDGRSGIVFDVEQLAVASLSQNDASRYSFPPLVVKVARSTRCMSMAREAWFYDHLECLQGVVIPRCYGWFELKLPHGCVVPAWTTYPSDDIETDAEEGPAAILGSSTWSLR